MAMPDAVARKMVIFTVVVVGLVEGESEASQLEHPARKRRRSLQRAEACRPPEIEVDSPVHTKVHTGAPTVKPTLVFPYSLV